MLLSSPRTKFLKQGKPALVFSVVTVVVLWVQRNEITSAPLTTLFLFVALYACAAWVLWRPFGLRMADSVKDRSNLLVIRRGNVEVQLPYSDVKRFEVLILGVTRGAKLVFSQPNAIGTEVGFYLGEASDPDTSGIDPADYLQARVGRVP